MYGKVCEYVYAFIYKYDIYSQWACYMYSLEKCVLK